MQKREPSVSMSLAPRGKRRRGDGTDENAPQSFHQHLALIGAEIKLLQDSVASSNPHGGPRLDDSAAQLWSLLLKLRPLLFLSSLRTAQLNELTGDDFQRWHTGVLQRDAAHAATTARLYMVLLRSAALSSPAAIHGFLTVVAMLPAVNDTRLMSWTSISDRTTEGILFLLSFFAAHDRSALQEVVRVLFCLLSQLTEELQGGKGHPAQPSSSVVLDAAFSPSAEIRERVSRALQGRYSTAVVPHLFAVKICLDAPYDAACFFYGLVKLVVEALRSRAILSLSVAQSTTLVRASCTLIALTIEDTTFPACVTEIWHAVAGNAIEWLWGNYFLKVHLHGPLVLGVLMERWRSRLTLLRSATSWEIAMLDWICSLSNDDLALLLQESHMRFAWTHQDDGLAFITDVVMQGCEELFSLHEDGPPSSSTPARRSALAALSVLQRCIHLFDRCLCVSAPPNQRDHRLHLLAERPGFSIQAASLICVGVPFAEERILVPQQLFFLPQSFLARFPTSFLTLLLQQRLFSGKEVLDVSAAALLEANVFAVLSQVRGVAVPQEQLQWFQKAITETLEVVQQHRSPNLKLLTMALTVLLHFAPDDEGAARAARQSMMLFEELITGSRIQPLCGSVPPALWSILGQEVGEQLLLHPSESLPYARLLLAPPSKDRVVKFSEAQVRRAAGVAVAFQELLLQAVRRVTGLLDAVKALPSSFTVTGERTESFGNQLRCEDKRLAAALKVVELLLIFTADGLAVSYSANASLEENPVLRALPLLCTPVSQVLLSLVSLRYCCLRLGSVTIGKESRAVSATGSVPAEVIVLDDENGTEGQDEVVEVVSHPLPRTQQRLDSAIAVNEAKLLPAILALQQAGWPLYSSDTPSSTPLNGRADETVAPKSGASSNAAQLAVLDALTSLTYSSIALSPTFAFPLPLFSLTLRVAEKRTALSRNFLPFVVREWLLWGAAAIEAQAASRFAKDGDFRISGFLLTGMHGGSASGAASLSPRVEEGNRMKYLAVLKLCFDASYYGKHRTEWDILEMTLHLQMGYLSSSDSMLKEAEAIIFYCFHVYESLTAESYVLQATCLEVSRLIMKLFSWTTVDLCRLRRGTPLALSNFFASLVNIEERNLSEVLTASMDVLLGPYVLSIPGRVADAERRTALADVEAILGDSIKVGRLTKAAILAYVLYECGGSSVAKKMEYISELAAHVKLPSSAASSLVRDCIALAAQSIISLEADAQLEARVRRVKSGRVCTLPQGGSGDLNIVASDPLNSIAFSIFESAMRQLVALAECEPSIAAMEKALASPPRVSLAAEVLAKYIFAVLDGIFQVLGIQERRVDSRDGESQLDALMSVSIPTFQRWLMGLTSFLRFMGPQATLIAAKLPSLLEKCSAVPALVPFVCTLWYELVKCCSDCYLWESAAAVVVDLVSIEHNSTVNEESWSLLLVAVRHIYQRTQCATFWHSYLKVLGQTSRLIATAIPDQSKNNSDATPRRSFRRYSSKLNSNLSGVELESGVSLMHANVIVSGFISVMVSASSKCKRVFLRDLYFYLLEMDPGSRLSMSEAAAMQQQFLPILLRCTAESDQQTALYALRCIGMVGAVTSSVAFPATLQEQSPSAEGSQCGNPAPSLNEGDKKIDEINNSSNCPPVGYLDGESVLNWRKLAYTLLQVYCPRSLGETESPAVHDLAAFAVQELLRVCTKQERELQKGLPLRSEEMVHIDELQRYLWWAKLSTSTKQLLGGFTTTLYTVRILITTENEVPVYKRGMTYDRWLFSFFKSLVVRTEGFFAEVVATLRNVAKKNASLMLYLIPYIVVHLIEVGRSEHVEAILAEVEVVMMAAIGSDADQALSLRSQNVYEVHPRDAPHREAMEHAQSILNILEDIEQLRWSFIKYRGDVPRTFESMAGSDAAPLRLAELYGDFLIRVPWSLQCRTAIKMGSHVRALRSLEGLRYLLPVAEVIKLVPLQRIFSALKDRESSRSIHRASQHLSLEDTAFSYENNGEWLSALHTTELVLQHRPHSIEHQLTSLHCIHELGELHLLSRYAAALLNDSATSWHPHGNGKVTPTEELLAKEQHEEEDPRIRAYANEAAWRLGEWDNVVSRENLPGSLAVPAACLMSIFEGGGDVAAVSRAADIERVKLIPAIRTTCQEDLGMQGRTFAPLLHALGDMEIVSKFCHRSTGTNHMPSRKEQEVVCNVLKTRMAYVDDTLEARESLLALHRTVYRVFDMPEKVAETWIEHAGLLRYAGLGEAALTAARQAHFECPNSLANTDYYTLVAELIHSHQTPMEAVTFAQTHAVNADIPAHVRAKLQVLATDWLLEIGSQTPKEVIDAYEKAKAMDDTSEVVHHQMALFFDKLYNFSIEASETAFSSSGAGAKGSSHGSSSGGSGNSSTTRGSPHGRYNHEVTSSVKQYAFPAIRFFGESLLRGTSKVSVSLPRMLTLWLDSTSFLHNLNGGATDTGGNDEIPTLLRTMNATVESFFLRVRGPVIAPAVVMTALPQLLSRLGHPCPAVVSVLTRVVVHLMEFFPQQCLWLVLPIASSRMGAKEVVRSQILCNFVTSPVKEKIMGYGYSICSTLLAICNCPATPFAKGNGLTQVPAVQTLNTLLPEANFILPTLANFTPDISATSVSEVYPGTPLFACVEDRVKIMNSLQKPKRIWIRSNEGLSVSFLCKSKDEPRKDIRMMEIASLMNSFFLSDPEAKRQRFCLRRYCIAALTDDCAVIEWVDEIKPLRNILTDCYAFDGSGVRISQVKAWVAKVENKTLSRMELFTNHILPSAPPVFHQWFNMTFSNHQSWYEARNLFTRSTALWSIAGHIVGLGDRHAENLMIDEEHGELMHVDFACMFDKGETLEVPERVRFRLTQNIVDGMGILGADGPFRAISEVVLRCEMKNKNAVMSIVETLLHEPLAEWTSRSFRAKSGEPKRLFERVARRLNGFLDLYSNPREPDTLALNVESQVTKLIRHSSALENLSEMYIWWMAWM